jgi:signal transduction histidine kinase
VVFLKKTSQPIVLEELKAQMGSSSTHDPQSWENSRVCAEMERLHASVIVPSFIEQLLIGFLVLGEKRKGQIFTTEDLIVFSTLANQAAVAIENARFYEGERDRQAALFHAATLASLGTMASSMGHQVNNRFNVVALISSSQKMKLRGLLANGSDFERLRKALSECLEQFESLEEEAIQGGRIVASIRKLARPSTEGHKPLALRAAIKAGMDVVQHKVHFEEFDLQLDIPDDLPSVMGDLSQLGECFLNFIDNAYDSMKTKEQLINEGKLPSRSGAPPYRGAILIHAWAKDPRTVQVVIADNGTGVHPEELRKLFIPFYTTKATAEKGTGLGLYVIKQIIEAHGGAIQAKSTYGEGMTFTIELPIAKESEAAQRAVG